MAYERYYDDGLTVAIAEIASTYGDAVSVFDKSKTLLKFGRNTSVGTNALGYTLMELQGTERHETYVDTNIIDTVSSSSTSDTIDMVVEGHTISESGFTFSVQTVTLNGRNKVTLGTPIARISRMYNDSATNLVGNVYVYEDGDITAGVPNTDSEVHLTVLAAKNQSEKSATTISSTDYWIITSMYASCLDKSSSVFADVELQIRLYNKVFRERTDVSCGSGESTIFNITPYLIVPKNSDIRLSAVASANSKDIAGGINGYLAKIV